jgi:esterase
MLSFVLHPAQTPGASPPLLIVHGLFGSARNWGVIARRLADLRDVIAVDMRNHGTSPWFPTQGYPEMAEDLAEVIAAHGGRADVLGHSMGGKAAMVLALTRPDVVGRLVVADIAPVAYAHDNTGHVRAMQALPLDGVTSRTEADVRLAAIMPDNSLRAFLLQSLDLRASPSRWRLNLDVLAAEMPKIVGWPEIGGQFPGRTLFVSGANSDYVRPENRAAILPLFPAARFVKISGAGHWLHAEKPREFEETVRTFLSREA